MRPTSTQATPNDIQPPPAVMQILAEDEAGDSRFFRWSMGLAVAAHLVFFVTNWGFLAFGGEGPDTEQNKPRLYVVKIVKFQEPPKIDRNITLPQTKSVPIPDPTPDDPEPIRPPENIEITETAPPEFVPGPFPEPPPPEEPTGPIYVTGDVTPPVKVSGPDPVYPKAALSARIQGTVILQCIIGTDGRVKSITPLRELPLGLTESAVSAVERWVFTPSTLNGKEVEVIYNLTVRFNTNTR